MSSNYDYKPLREDHIRLIALHPATSADAPLECSMYVRKRSSCEDYEALSYVWAASKEEGFFPLKVRHSDEHPPTHGGWFVIRTNLAAALKQFRHTYDDILLWIDAVCINQSNDYEKSQQVPMMHLTYSQASRVLVWLGAETKTSKQAMRFIWKIADATVHVKELLDGFAEDWQALEALMRMPWFTRLWVIQEIALAKDAVVYCGDDRISWREFCDAVSMFTVHYLDIKAVSLNATSRSTRRRMGDTKALGACRLVEITSNLLRKSEDGSVQRRLASLEDLVPLVTASFQASQPQDIIYAVVGIAKDVRVVAQQDHDFAPGTRPAETPERYLDEDVAEPVPQRKRRRITRDTSGTLTKMKRRAFTQEVIDKLIPAGVVRDRDILHEGTTRLQMVVNEVTSNMPSKFEVDYRKSFLRVCMDFVGFAILRSKSLDILCRPWVPEALKERLGLPSWLLSTERCPFWRRADGTFARVNADVLVDEQTAVTTRYCSSGSNSRARRVTRAVPDYGWGFGFFDRPSAFDDTFHEHRSLFVSGFILANIEDIRDKAEDGTIPNDWLRFGGWVDRSSLPPDALWRILVADRQIDGTFIGSYSYYQRILRDLVRQHTTRNGALNVKAILALPDCDRTSEMVLERVLTVVTNRRLYKIQAETKGSLLGLAPAEAKAGDMLCILYGCSVPVVLRRHTKSLCGKDVPYYEFIGDSYVHGMMEGEALEEQAARDIPPLQFEMR